MSVLRGIAALLRSNDRRFIDLLARQADLNLEALELLELFGEAGADRRDLASRVTAIEHQADDVRRVLIEQLSETYATPFDREDIFALSRSIDDITDATNEAAAELTTYEVAPPHLVGMVELLLEGSRHIRNAVGALLDKPSAAMREAVAAKSMENQIDALYHASVVRLLEGEDDIIAKLKTREVYRHLKNSADRIDRAADDLAVIVIKRT